MPRLYTSRWSRREVHNDDGNTAYRFYHKSPHRMESPAYKETTGPTSRTYPGSSEDRYEPSKQSVTHYMPMLPMCRCATCLTATEKIIPFPTPCDALFANMVAKSEVRVTPTHRRHRHWNGQRSLPRGGGMVAGRRPRMGRCGGGGQNKRNNSPPWKSCWSVRGKGIGFTRWPSEQNTQRRIRMLRQPV